MKKKIIVAPLNWGLGHATRCVPIIHFLLENKFTPVIASDGKALLFLQQEFPNLESIELPSYGISYAKNLKTSLLFQFPKIYSVIQKEKKEIDTYIKENKTVVGVISDNRLGIRSAEVPSVYITHQIQMFSGVTTVVSSKIHQHIINKFDQCWIPDSKEQTLSGELSNPQKLKIPYKFIGILSRFSKEEIPIKNDVLIILSGIEFQRKTLELKLLNEFKNYKGKVVLVQGKIENQQTIKEQNEITIHNYLLSSELEKEINQSKIIVCRSGYSSIMDLAALEKKVFFIPTPNQPEQEYLAMHLSEQKQAPFSTEQDFVIEKLEELENYKGLRVEKNGLDIDIPIDFFREIIENLKKN
jgi:uncharacterized protein (TIGR00661 family)